MEGYILIVLQILIAGLICFMFTETATESKYSLTGDSNNAALRTSLTCLISASGISVIHRLISGETGADHLL